MPHIRRSGILLHPTSLPGSEGIGSLGDEAFRFLDFLHSAGQTLWQILPLGPPGSGNSPYSCFSAFAGNPLLIELKQIAADGDLAFNELQEFPNVGRIDFSAVSSYKLPLLRRAAEKFFISGNISRKEDFWRFCDATFWLHDYALYAALKGYFNGECWNRWPEKLRKRDKEACSEYAEKLGREIGFQKYLQWQFSRQWYRVKHYAHKRNISIIGDAPIFVAHDSADVWCNQHIFNLDEKGSPLAVAGVPPDYFSKTGQRWGNPLYRWDTLAADNYGWWIARIKSDLALYDILRIDHFRGFEAYWEIPVKEETAVNGRWVKGPGYGLFAALRAALGELPVIAEDLGVITHEVELLREQCAFPGMRILQFAFDSGADNSYLPHNHIPAAVVYTGTHDNDTTKGWFEALDPVKKRRVCDYLQAVPEDVPAILIRTALASVAMYAIIPLQDILSLGSSERMNIPGQADGNWGWRLLPGYAEGARALELKKFSELYNRNGQQ